MSEAWKDPEEAFIERPPRPRMVVRVGVTGHRKLIEDDDLCEKIRWALQEVEKVALEAFYEGRDYFDPNQEKPILRLISPLAEGADRLVARIALDLGYKLQAPLPFSTENYKKDFPGSIDEFDRLLSQAETTFVLDYPYDPEDERPQGYQAAGRLVLRQSDILIAIWNGRPAQGIGGAQLVVEEALSWGIPTLCIDVQQPHTVTLVNPKKPTATESDLLTTGQKLREHLRQNLLPYVDTKARTRRAQEKEKGNLKTYLAEEVLKAGRTREAEEPILEKAFRISDHLANRYGPLYRFAYRSTYLLGALAVLFAYLGSLSQPLLGPLPTPLSAVLPEARNSGYLVFEIGTLLSILMLTLFGRLRFWHERWLGYRHLAESLRTIRYLIPFGLVTPFFQVPAHLGKGDPRKAWFHFHYRTLVRDAGPVSTQMDSTDRSRLYALVEAAIQGQITYHTKTEGNSHSHHELWHVVTQILFFIALIACLIHLVAHSESVPLTLAAIVLPAFAGAIGAALHHGESKRIAYRSEALKEQLGTLKSDLEELKPTPKEVPSYRDLVKIAEQFSTLMQSELADWRFLFLARPLTLPA